MTESAFNLSLKYQKEAKTMSEKLKEKVLEAMGFVYNDKDVSPICTTDVRDKVLKVISGTETEIQQLKEEVEIYKKAYHRYVEKKNKLTEQVEAAKTLTEKESKTLRQILYDSGIEAKVIGWAGNKELILTQKYIPQVFLVEVLSQRKSESAQNNEASL